MFREGLKTNTSGENTDHSIEYLRRELSGFKAGTEKIGWDMTGAELRDLNVADLREEDLVVFDHVENCVEVDDQKIKELEAEIKFNFSGVDQFKDSSRHAFSAFLRNLALGRWSQYRSQKRKQTLH